MKLNEQVFRIKEMMGLQPINEGIFRRKGKLKDILKVLFKTKTDSTNDFVNIIDDVDLYEQQYGSPSKDMVFNVSSEGYSDTSITTEQKDRNNLFITIITQDPFPLPSDPSKKTTNYSCNLEFRKIKNNKREFYRYFKMIFYIDGKETDKLSSIKVNDKYTCSSGTLSGKPGDCVFSEDLKKNIEDTFKDSSDINEIKNWLSKIK